MAVTALATRTYYLADIAQITGKTIGALKEAHNSAKRDKGIDLPSLSEKELLEESQIEFFFSKYNISSMEKKVVHLSNGKPTDTNSVSSTDDLLSLLSQAKKDKDALLSQIEKDKKAFLSELDRIEKERKEAVSKLESTERELAQERQTFSFKLSSETAKTNAEIQKKTALQNDLDAAKLRLQNLDNQRDTLTSANANTQVNLRKTELEKDAEIRRLIADAERDKKDAEKETKRLLSEFEKERAEWQKEKTETDSKWDRFKKEAEAEIKRIRDLTEIMTAEFEKERLSFLSQIQAVKDEADKQIAIFKAYAQKWEGVEAAFKKDIFLHNIKFAFAIVGCLIAVQAVEAALFTQLAYKDAGFYGLWVKIVGAFLCFGLQCTGLFLTVNRKKSFRAIQIGVDEWNNPIYKKNEITGEIEVEIYYEMTTMRLFCLLDFVINCFVFFQNTNIKTAPIEVTARLFCFSLIVPMAIYFTSEILLFILSKREKLIS